MSDDFTPKSHRENFVKLQRQDSFHMKKLKFYFEIHRQIFAPKVVQTIILQYIIKNNSTFKNPILNSTLASDFGRFQRTLSIIVLNHFLMLNN